MDPPRPADRDSRPYVFVCYSHTDKEVVYPEIAQLQAQNVAVWYDRGISTGTEWTEEVASAIRDCSSFLYFVSPASVTTRHCLNEIHYALDHTKPIVAVHLETTVLPAGLQLSLGRIQALLRHDLNEQTYRNELYSSLRNPVSSESAPASLRPSSAAEVIERLFSSIAVLRFDNRTNDPQLDPMGEDVAELITDSLARVGFISSGGFRLIGSRETARLRAYSAREIAEALDVGGILRGTLRRAGNRVRLTVELANANGEQVWRQPFDEAFDALTHEPDRLTDQVVSACLDAIERYGLQRVTAIPTESLGPRGLLLKATTISDVDPSGPKTRRELMERATDMVPGGMGNALLANRIAFDLVYGFSTDRAADRKRVLELVEQSAGSDSALALMHTGIACAALRQHDQAVAISRRAYQKAPRYLPVVLNLASNLLWAGDPQTALSYYQEAESLRPQGHRSSYSTNIAECYLAIGDVPAAVEAAKSLIGMGVHTANLYVTLANALASMGRIEEAVEAIENARKRVPRLRIAEWIHGLSRQCATQEVASAITGGLQLLVDRGYE